MNPLEPPTDATARRERLASIAWWLTGVWALVFVLGVCLKLEDVSVMSLNEWGDFFAGAAAPLALLWLVIGYFQHGEELRLNTQALHAQQLELERQVEETAQLVEATRENVRIMEARDAREAAPKFRFGGSSSSGSGMFSVRIRNRGAEVRNVKVHCDGPHDYTLPEQDIMPTDGEIELSIQHGERPLTYPIIFMISCLDGLDKRHNVPLEIPAEGRGFRPAKGSGDSTEPVAR